MRTISKIIFIALLFVIIISSCRKENLESKYITKNVIIIVIDGARYSETWGDTSHQYIPRLSNQLSKSGIINTQFYNNGPTYTVSGHTSITTGYYQEIDNSGNEFPLYPSIFQCWNEKYQLSPQFSWIIASKDKLEILQNCLFIDFKDNYLPSTDCGIEGIGSGYRHDRVTLRKILNILNLHHPRLILVNFREPDYSAHTGIWEDYIHGVKITDEYAFKIWEYIQNDNYYKGKTTLFITNDHGRHLDNVSDGFISHGDTCLGCRHINFFACGPDFKEDIILNTKREIIDISATISELLGFDMEFSQGEIMDELFK
jgi:hypothetical protein